MAEFLKFDIYGNPGPGADYAPLSAKFQDLSASQQAGRLQYLHERGALPSDLPLSHELFTSDNVDAWYALIGGPKPSHKEPIGQTIGKVVQSVLGKINPAGAALASAAGALARDLRGDRPVSRYSTEWFSRIPDVAGQGAAGTGGGILGAALGIAGALGVVKNPRTRALLADSAGVIGSILGTGGLVSSLTVR